MWFAKYIVGIQVVSIALGIPINILVLVVRAVKYYQRKKFSSYHFVIVNLAICDLISSVLFNFDVQNTLQNFNWPYSLTACKIVKSIHSITTDVPAMFMILLAFERYQGTVNCLTKKLRLRTTVLISFAIWTFTACVKIPLFSMHLTFRFTNTSGPHCVPKYPIGTTTRYQKYYLNFRMITFLAIPLLVTSFFHYKLYSFIRSHGSNMAAVFESDRSRSSSTTTSVFSRSDSYNGGSSSRKGSLDPSQLSHNNSRRPTLSAILEKDEIIDGVATQWKLDEILLLQIAREQSSPWKRFCRALGSFFHRCAGNKTMMSATQRRINKSIRLKIHILLAITVAFFVCMFPSLLYHYLFLYNPLQGIDREIFIVFTWIRYPHSFINGLIYSVMDRTFRRDTFMIFKTLVTCKPHFRYDEPSVSMKLKGSRTLSVESTCIRD